MKKLILIGILVLMGGFTIGQTLKTGNLVGIHVLTIELNPGVIMKQFQDFQLPESATPTFQSSMDPG